MSHQKRHIRKSKYGKPFRAGRKIADARKFIARKIKANLIEGYPIKQAIAISYGEARSLGYRIPRRK